MKIINKDIDSGTPFDWGKTSLDYAKFRDIYPQEFYQRIVGRKLCIDGQGFSSDGIAPYWEENNLWQPCKPKPNFLHL